MILNFVEILKYRDLTQKNTRKLCKSRDLSNPILKPRKNNIARNIFPLAIQLFNQICSDDSKPPPVISIAKTIVVGGNSVAHTLRNIYMSTSSKKIQPHHKYH